MEARAIEELNPLQTFLLALVEFGLTTPYELLSRAGLGPGLTSPALKRLEQAGLLISTPGPRNRLRYEITEKGAFFLRQSTQPGENNYWQAGEVDAFESLPRGIILAWLYTGTDEARRGVERASENLLLAARKKAREAQDLREDTLRLQADLSKNRSGVNKGMLIATAYKWIKAESDSALYQLQAKAVEKLAPLLEQLPPPPKTVYEVGASAEDLIEIQSMKPSKRKSPPKHNPLKSRNRRVRVPAGQQPFDLDSIEKGEQ